MSIINHERTFPSNDIVSTDGSKKQERHMNSIVQLYTNCHRPVIFDHEILQDRLVFGIRDDKVQEHLLRESALTLAKTDEICHAAESMMAQMNIFSDSGSTTVSVVKSESNKEDKLRPDSIIPPKQIRE